MSNTTKWIPQTVKLDLIVRIEAMPESRDKQILTDVFVHEMSCKQVADSMRYLSNRGTPISHRQVVNVVNAFYPDYSNASKGKGHARNRNKESQIAEAFKWVLIAERGCKCEQCGKVGVKLELHHIIPIAFGGETNREKLNRECMYDLLCRMQENTFELMYKLGNNPCVIAYITGEAQGGRCVDFMEGTEEKCSECLGNCGAYFGE